MLLDGWSISLLFDELFDFYRAFGRGRPAERPLPHSLADCIGPDGKPRLARIAGRACLRPWEVFALLQLRRDSAAALASLGRLLGGLGPAGLA